MFFTCRKRGTCYGNVAGWLAGWLGGCLSQPVLYQNDKTFLKTFSTI